MTGNSGFVNYLVKRVLLGIPVLLGVSIGVFLLIKLTPGDPINAILPTQARTPANVAQVRQRLGLGEPLYVQYWSWLSNAVQGDLGYSYNRGEPVTQLILSRIWPTAQLAFIALLVALFIAIPSGVISAVYKDTFVDHFSRIIAFVGISVPAFWLGIMIILVFALFWKQLFGFALIPAGGYVPPSDSLIEWLQYVAAPGITLGVGYAALTARMTRSTMVDVLNEEYIQTARSKGVKESVIVSIHAFRNALIPIVTVLGIQIGFLFNGSVVVEQVFQWPGIGRLLYQAVIDKDLPLIQGILLFVAAVFVVANLVVDLLYAYLDPRIKYN
ncbi:ABC transporter permease [Halostella pelagica]|uniref:ABC transporter permease n=1 Tax=Halostella pelagica TaxID=2583824 RepID=UPI001081AD6C|nr:ABC transporter permease [Halostella pelagica]